MRQIEKKGIYYKSSDGENTVAAVFYYPKEPPSCIVQISHGMCEYIGRYDHFARFLAQNGVAVCGNDHLGHGDTAASPKEYGYFGQHGARQFVLQDLKYMNKLAKKTFPGVPLVLLGHSMGSFFARAFAVRWPEDLDALILSGTGGYNPLLSVALGVARAQEKVKGARHRSRFLQRLTFGSYLARIPDAKTRYDWIAKNKTVVHQYVRDPKCNFLFTIGGFWELFSIIQEVSGPAWAASMPKSLPVFLFAGQEDPVGEYGRGVKQVESWLEKAGVGPLSCRLYPNGRHEMLNEESREEVYQDVLNFLKEYELVGNC